MLPEERRLRAHRLPQRSEAGPLPYAQRQVPEPWTGHLAEVRLLFLSSNPSTSWQEEYPLGAWTDEAVADFFDNRFDTARSAPWVQNGNRFRQTDGTYSRGALFWSSVRRRAEEAYGREVDPGDGGR